MNPQYSLCARLCAFLFFLETAESFLVPVSSQRKTATPATVLQKGKGRNKAYSWDEDEKDINVYFSVDPSTTSADISFFKNSRQIELKAGETVLLKGDLRGRIDPQDAVFFFADEHEDMDPNKSKILQVQLPKNERKEKGYANDWFGAVIGDEADFVDYLGFVDGSEAEYREVKGTDFARDLVQRVESWQNNENEKMGDLAYYLKERVKFAELLGLEVHSEKET